jgi:anti-sigma factor RsiW
MNCQEAMNLWSSYRDGELDPAFCGEIQRHLAACADCRSFFEAQGQFDAVLTRSLTQRRRTASLWRKEESAVRAAFGSAGLETAPDSFWAGFLWPGRAFYGALAALWLLLLLANRLADYRGTPQTQNLSPAQKEILAAQRREFKALWMGTDLDGTATATQPRGPRSQWRSAPGTMPTTGLCQTQAILQIS